MIKLDNFCCIGANMQNDGLTNNKQSQIFFYRTTNPAETIKVMLEDYYFDSLSDRLFINDLLILFNPTLDDNYYVITKIIENKGGRVKIAPTTPSAEYISMNPEWADLLPEKIQAKNLKEYIIQLTEHLNNKVVHNWDGADEIVKGKKTFQDEAVFNKDVNIKGNTGIDKNTTIGGNTEIAGTAKIGGDTTIGGNTEIKKQATIKENLQVDGEANFNKKANINDHYFLFINK